jgi:hypothetical protein
MALSAPTFEHEHEDGRRTVCMYDNAALELV